MKEVGAQRGDRVVVSVSLPILTANSTKYYGILVVPFDCKLVAAWVAAEDAPASALGTVLLNLFNYDVSATADDALLETADYDLEGLTDKNGAELTLQTTNAERLIISAGDFIYAKVVSNNADMTDGEGVTITLVLEPSKFES